MNYSPIAPRVAAAVAGFGLVAMSFAPLAGAQTTTTTTTTTTATFSRDLTIGSTGADVTALQNWLIGKGYAIAAGATGYFGAQTKAALAAYQAANMITPAAGYFGPITRSSLIVSVGTQPTQEEGGASEDPNADVMEEINDIQDQIDQLRDDVEEAEEDGQDTEDSEELLDEAQELVNDAETAFAADNFSKTQELIEEASDLIEEAKRELKDSENIDSGVTTSAEVRERSGSDNDSAEFEITLSLKAFGDDMYISRTPSTSIDYEIQDADGDAVSGGAISNILRSSAGTDGEYYVIREDERENFTFTVTFNPDAPDEGDYFALQLLEIAYADSATNPDREWNSGSDSKYRTKFVFIAD